jgi:hypothetical protein
MTFLNPLLLIGALGVALPILAHLINRQQVQRTDWAAMQFLNRSVRVRSRQIRLRDILLLLMRCLALLLLVFALARPATSGDSSWMPGETRAGVVIAIDGSFSMDHRDGDSTRFERAIEQVNVISEQINPGDPVSLVLLGGEHKVLLRNVAYDPDRFAQVLSRQTPTPQTMELDSVPKQLEALVEDMDALQKEVYLVTDTQTQAWGQASTPRRDALRQLSEKASVFLVPVKGSENNLAVTNLDLVSGSLRNGAVARYRATVHNYGQSPVSNIEVRCRVEGVQIDRKLIPLIAPGTSETVSLFVPFYNAGATRITAEITDEALTTDNVRRVVAVVREKVSVLCFDGSGGNASRLVMASLLARADGTEDDGYIVRTAQWPSFPADGLERFDVIILTDIPEVTPQQAEQLSRFVRQGNGLVWFAGQNVKASQWNELANQTALLPAKLGQIVDVRDDLGVGKPLAAAMPDHTIVRPLQSLPEDLLNETRFLKRIQAEPYDTSFPVLSLAGSGSPVLLEQSLGRGHVFMFTTSADTAWNNMALTPVFPMLMQQIVTYLSGREFELPRVVGDSLTLSYVDQPDATDAVFDTPSEETITVPVREHRNQYVALLEQSQEAGFYTARVSVQAAGLPIAVNVDTNESDVACMDSVALVESLSDTGVEVVVNDGELAAGINTARTGRSSWRFFLLAALCLLLAESLFADRLHGRKQSRQATPPQIAEVV